VPQIRVAEYRDQKNVRLVKYQEGVIVLIDYDNLLLGIFPKFPKIIQLENHQQYRIFLNLCISHHLDLICLGK
jgi:hypothetical protein